MSFLSSSLMLAGEHKKKNPTKSFYATIIVLSLFIIQLLIAPLTFSSFWHCPMMHDMNTGMSMNMDNCVHMQHMDQSATSHNPQHKPSHAQHGIFICPLCNSFALPSTLLNNAPILPALSIAIISYQHKAYFSQAPPHNPLKTNSPRAPPLF